MDPSQPQVLVNYDFRLGSIASFRRYAEHFRSAIESRQVQSRVACLKGAIKRLGIAANLDGFDRLCGLCGALDVRFGLIE
jgi:hypothetical protein